MAVCVADNICRRQDSIVRHQYSGENFGSRFFYVYVCVNQKYFVILFCRVGLDPTMTYFYESVFAFVLSRKCGSFQCKRTKRRALITCVAMWLCTHCAYTSYYPGVGQCIVYSCIGLSTTFYLTNENQLHTFFVLYSQVFRGWMLLLYYYEEIFYLCWPRYGFSKLFYTDFYTAGPNTNHTDKLRVRDSAVVGTSSRARGDNASYPTYRRPRSI